MSVRRVTLGLLILNGILMAAMAWRLVDLKRDARVRQVQSELRAYDQANEWRSAR